MIKMKPGQEPRRRHCLTLDGDLGRKIHVTSMARARHGTQAWSGGGGSDSKSVVLRKPWWECAASKREVLLTDKAS